MKRMLLLVPGGLVPKTCYRGAPRKTKAQAQAQARALANTFGWESLRGFASDASASRLRLDPALPAPVLPEEDGALVGSDGGGGGGGAVLEGVGVAAGVVAPVCHEPAAYCQEKIDSTSHDCTRDMCSTDLGGPDPQLSCERTASSFVRPVLRQTSCSGSACHEVRSGEIYRLSMPFWIYCAGTHVLGLPCISAAMRGERLLAG